MPNINDQEPIYYKGKKLYDSELDRIKKTNGFLPAIPKNAGQDPEDMARRWLARMKLKKNKAR